MDSFQHNQATIRDALSGNVFADIAKRYMEIFKDAAPFAPKAKPDAKPAAEKPASESEMEQLRAEMAALQAKVDKLSR
jgi:polyhydroxyalkanoate synthesis regulator protein